MDEWISREVPEKSTKLACEFTRLTISEFFYRGYTKVYENPVTSTQDMKRRIKDIFETITPRALCSMKNSFQKNLFMYRKRCGIILAINKYFQPLILIFLFFRFSFFISCGSIIVIVVKYVSKPFKYFDVYFLVFCSIALLSYWKFYWNIQIINNSVSIFLKYEPSSV